MKRMFTTSKGKERR